MLMITTQDCTFGRGYFLGFTRDGLAWFQSCFDKRVKIYKTQRNAAAQLERIRALPFADAKGTTYKIELTPLAAATGGKEG